MHLQRGYLNPCPQEIYVSKIFTFDKFKNHYMCRNFNESFVLYILRLQAKICIDFKYVFIYVLLKLCTQIRITYVCTYRNLYVSLTDNLPYCPNQFYIAFLLFYINAFRNNKYINKLEV